MLIRIRRAALWALVVVCAVAGRAPKASAAAEIHKLNFLISGNPSSLAAEQYNNLINNYNSAVLDPRGYEPLKGMHFAWFFQAQLRYFVRPNITVDGGYGNLQDDQKAEFLPRIKQSIDIDTYIKTNVWNVGGSYYLQPYNQGDFQARMYFSAGLLSLSNTEVNFSKTEDGTDSTSTLGSAVGNTNRYDYTYKGKLEGPGWYLEGGAHLFFAVRYSVMLGVMYRNMSVSAVPVTLTEFDPSGVAHPQPSPTGPVEVDLSGVSARMGICIGF
ncbi:MAG: hypothetical protein ACHQ52_01195 [Candidatus Eisenbacteria bacterium]